MHTTMSQCRQPSQHLVHLPSLLTSCSTHAVWTDTWSAPPGTIHTLANGHSLAAGTLAAQPTLGKMKKATQVWPGGLEPLGQGLLGSWFPEHGLERKKQEWALGGHKPLALQSPHQRGEALERRSHCRVEGWSL